jgi:hypothetical protein
MCLLAFVVAATTAYPGCRAVDGLGGLVFDIAADGGIDTSCASPGDVCIAAVPSGWSGPIAVFEASLGAEPPCPSAYPLKVVAGGTQPSGPPPTCTTCTCADSTPTCTPGVVEFRSNPNCHGGSMDVQPSDGMCTMAGGLGDHVLVQPPVLAGGCGPSGGSPMLAPVTWASQGVACATRVTGGSCPACAPAPPPPFAGWCIWRAGNATCPNEFPSARVWLSADDHRGCTPCSCGATGTMCSVTTSLYGDAACKNDLVDITMPGQCVAQSNITAVMTTTMITGSPSCTPSGGNPTGSVDAQTVATICCRP